MPAYNILVVDDEPANRRLLDELLGELGHHAELAEDGVEALAKLKLGVDLVLLDLNMPGMDGFEVTRRIREQSDSADLPIIMLTGLNGASLRMRALESGVDDFLNKPFDLAELRVRIQSQLRLREAREALKRKQVDLELIVVQRTAALRRTIDEAVGSQRETWQAHLDTIERLVLAAEYKDQATAAHSKRVGESCALLGEKLELPPGDVETLRYASPMHDVGKLGIPDSVLLKPGRLSDEERAIMEQHTEIGARILRGSGSKLLQAGETIALTHHERWDGHGYPRGLAGEEIPLWGRICAVVDVYDALGTDRPYRPAFSLEEILYLMRQGRSTQFDPAILDVFFANLERIQAVASP